MWKRLVYWAFVVIFGILFYIVMYASYLSEYKLGMVEDAINNGEFHIVPQIFLEVPFDTKSIIEDESSEVEIEIYPASGMVSFSYTVGETVKSYARQESAYLLFIHSAKFPVASYTDSGDNKVNKMAINFIGENGVYPLNFVQNEYYNKDSYKETPRSEKESLMNSSRDFTTVYTDWGFIPISISESTIKYIEEVTGTISEFELIDAVGSVVYKDEIAFTFTEDFFSNDFIKGAKEELNVKLDEYYTTTDTKRKNTLGNEIDDYLKEFKETFSEKTSGTTYAMSLEKKVIEPFFIYMKTLGVLFIFFVVSFVLYLLLFFFKQVRSFISGLFNKDKRSTKNNKNKTYIVEKNQTKPIIKDQNTKNVVENENNSENNN